jgi:hypothetical protein
MRPPSGRHSRLSNAAVGTANRHVFLVHDRDNCYGTGFDRRVRNLGIARARTPFRSPRANAITKRWVRSVRTECLDHLFIFNQRHLQKVQPLAPASFDRTTCAQCTGGTCASSSKRSRSKDRRNTCARGPPSRLSASRMMSSITFLRPTGPPSMPDRPRPSCGCGAADRGG